MLYLRMISVAKKSESIGMILHQSAFRSDSCTSPSSSCTIQSGCRSSVLNRLLNQHISFGIPPGCNAYHLPHLELLRCCSMHSGYKQSMCVWTDQRFLSAPRHFHSPLFWMPHQGRSPWSSGRFSGAGGDLDTSCSMLSPSKAAHTAGASESFRGTP